MSSTMELNPEFWQFFNDTSQRIEKAADEALRHIGWNKQVLWTRVAHRRGSGAGDATCVEIWCVQLVDVEPEIRHCLSIRDADPEGEMVNRLAETFAALRSGGLIIRTYEGMESANKAQEEFERQHAGHQTKHTIPMDHLIVTQCFDCLVEFREYYTPAPRPA